MIDSWEWNAIGQEHVSVVPWHCVVTPQPLLHRLWLREHLQVNQGELIGTAEISWPTLPEFQRQKQKSCRVV